MDIFGLAANRRTILIAMVGLLVCLSGTQPLSGADDFDLRFRNPLDNTELSWMAQPSATEYQLLRATLKDFAADCTTFETSNLYETDATEPDPEGLLYYLVRVLMPDPGSWGVDSGGSVRPVPCMAPTGSLIDSYGCKDKSGAKLAQDCIEYHYLGGGYLLLNHINAAFNCCPEFEADIDVAGDTITVTEVEISGICYCLCLFDLNYEIVGLTPGVYNVTVIQEWLEPDDEPLDFTMDLLSSPSGIHCVERDHYPW